MERLEDRFELVRFNGLLWIDIKQPSREDMNTLGTIFHFHDLNLEDCLSKIQLPKIDTYEDHMFIILHFPVYGENVPRAGQLSIFVGMDYVVTVHLGELAPLTEMFHRCRMDEKLCASIMGNSSGFLLHKIIDILVDDLVHPLMKLEGNLDDIEDLVFDENFSIARQISYLRREITALRRILLPLRRIVVEVAKDAQRFSKEDISPQFNDVKDHVEKVLETIEAARETIEIYKDTDFVLNTEKTNKILAVLTIVFTLSIPATVIGQYYGMNIPLPGGTETGPWTFFGEYTTFIIVILLSVIGAALMSIYFYRSGWLRL
ncbi:MAG: magnesium transporter CorA family protein [Nitrososphaerales archaeon]